MDHIPGCRPVPIARRERKLDTVIGQNRVDFIRDSLNQIFKKRGCRVAISLVHQLNKSEL